MKRTDELATFLVGLSRYRTRVHNYYIGAFVFRGTAYATVGKHLRHSRRLGKIQFASKRVKKRLQFLIFRQFCFHN